MRPKEALAILIAAFRQDKIDPATMAVYAKSMNDIPGAILEETINRLIGSSRFFPSIAEIRETAAGVCGLLPVTPAEAVAIVKQADVCEAKYDRAGRYCYTERYWNWPTGIKAATRVAIHKALSSVGDPYTQEGKFKYGWEQAFSSSYDAYATEEKLRDGPHHLRRRRSPGPGRTRTGRRGWGGRCLPGDLRRSRLLPAASCAPRAA